MSVQWRAGHLSRNHLCSVGLLLLEVECNPLRCFAVKRALPWIWIDVCFLRHLGDHSFPRCGDADKCVSDLRAASIARGRMSCISHHAISLKALRRKFSQ